jgi:hypothetical protein
MSFFRESCERAESWKRHPRMSDRLGIEQVERRLSMIGTSSLRAPEPWAAFLGRIDTTDAASLRPRDLRRLVDGIWNEARLDNQAEAVLDASVKLDRKSLDRAIIHSYLAYFPRDHLAFSALVGAAALVARRRDWPWNQRGKRWALWDGEQGPRTMADTLLKSDQPSDVLRQAGVDGDLASGAFVTASVAEACQLAAVMRGSAAEDAGARLISLMSTISGAGNLLGPLAYALLAPWTRDNCSNAHQRRVSTLLVQRVADPRLADSRWADLRANVSSWNPGADVGGAFAVLRRWLVQATVREFFSVVARTTDRRDQWKQRTDFWLAYLDAGVISDAWFAFGPMAERLARNLLQDETVGYAKIWGGGADPSHSALLFTIGDLRIAEWSHNGRARFWRVTDDKAPALYKPAYVGTSLRAMYGGAGFEALSHNGSWEPKFATHINRVTRVKHPRHGAGW